MVPHPWHRVKEGPRESGSQEVKDKTPGRVGRKKKETGKACSREGACTGSSFLRVLRVEDFRGDSGEDSNRIFSSFPAMSF